MISQWVSNILDQFKAVWTQLNQMQKLIVMISAGVLLFFLGLLIFVNSMTSYSLLFSPDRMQTIDIAEIRTYLDNADIPYKMKSDSLILVPSPRVHQIRMELAVYGLPKVQSTKGLEIFDNTTWVKGEKELQMLEIRALKGQLEKDISQFDNIRSANVILDIPPTRPFGDASYKPKASVILNLMPGARVSPQEVRAITYHVAGAIRGLSANMIAISDTTGKLYQAFDPDGALDAVRLSETSLEDHIKAKIDGLLSTVVGFDNFYTTVQVQMSRSIQTKERKVYSGNPSGVELGSPVVANISESIEQKPKLPGFPLFQKKNDEAILRENKQIAVPSEEIRIKSSPGKVESISIGALIDKNLFSEPLYMGVDKDELRKNIENQIATVLNAYSSKGTQSVDFVDFHHQLATYSGQATGAYTEQGLNLTLLFIYLGLILLIVLIILFTTMSSKKKKHRPLTNTPYTAAQPKEETLSQDTIVKIKEILSKASTNELATFIAKQQPIYAAEILVGTTPERLDVIFSLLPEEKKSEIFQEFVKMPSERFHEIASYFDNASHTKEEYIYNLLQLLPEGERHKFTHIKI